MLQSFETEDVAASSSARRRSIDSGFVSFEMPATQVLNSGSPLGLLSATSVAMQDGMGARGITPEMQVDMNQFKAKNQKLKSDRLCKICIDKESQVRKASVRLVGHCNSSKVISQLLSFPFSGFVHELWPPGHVPGLRGVFFPVSNVSNSNPVLCEDFFTRVQF